MSKMIQIRNVPVKVHRVLKARATLAGKSMSEMILQELQIMLALPLEQELRERLDQAEPFAIKKSSAGLIRRQRGAEGQPRIQRRDRRLPLNSDRGTS